MKQLLILSGKGGTGKTTVSSAFIKLSNASAFADCDVDAPNLHLVLSSEQPAKSTDFYGMDKAQINLKACNSCGICTENCKFGAIEKTEQGYIVNPLFCEGCSVCHSICPEGAVSMAPAVSGFLHLQKEKDYTFSSAELKVGSGNSGLLVTEIKNQLAENSADSTVAILDGSPGIGCPVIASLNQADVVLLVTEPSLSGISDMQRIIKTAEDFENQILVCVNKYDTNLQKTEKIKQYCEKKDIPFVGKIPFDHSAVKAVNSGKTLIDIDCPAGDAVRCIYNNVVQFL